MKARGARRRGQRRGAAQGACKGRQACGSAFFSSSACLPVSAYQPYAHSARIPIR